MKRINFKGIELTRTIVKNRILSVLPNTVPVETIEWYTEANTFAKSLVKQSDLTLIQVSGIIAALSPLKSWDENKRIAKAYIVDGIRRGLHTGVMMNKCHAITRVNTKKAVSDILRGNKIVNFFINIVAPKKVNGVTIDRHAIAICLGRPPTNKESQLTDNQYAFFESCYKLASEGLDMLPHQLQAVTWVQWRLQKANQVTA